MISKAKEEGHQNMSDDPKHHLHHHHHHHHHHQNLNQNQTLEPPPQQQQQQHEDEQADEIENLEREVRDMAEKIMHFRATVPDLLKQTLESALVAKRPLLPQLDLSQVPATSDRDQGSGENIELGNRALLEEDDPQTAAKICLLKSKISSNVSTMPVLLKRMNECIAAIDKLDRCNVDIHPAFKRKRKQQ